ncbi:hypothetical protein [Rufibacter roseolus]|uniref:hypothetical protein n=1 Tax=Rufibacter roseolus TaxID=2817375 RepID=UPI001B308077|nr:hypothetical protein [Rufibacter roseolus]
MMLLGKIQDEKYINDMYENEYLYFNSLKYFRSDSKDITGRLDPRELNTKNLQLKNLLIKKGDVEIELSEALSNFSGQYMEHPDDSTVSCCSLFTIDIDLNGVLSNVSDKALEMGNKMLLIFDCLAFFKILDESIVKCGYEYKRRPVIYYDPKTYNGDLTLHHKDLAFKFQEEYRILIESKENQPIKIPLPGLRNISVVIDSMAAKTLELKQKQ